MKLQLVDNLVMPESGNLDLLDVHPHLGLLSLAAVATTCGHQVGIYDPKRKVRSRELPYDSNLYEAVAHDLLQGSPDVVGFSTLGCSFLFVVNVAKLLKHAAPDLPILLGGPHATMLHQEIMQRFSQFDAVVRFEAEHTLAPVLGAMDNRHFEGIPGITWRSGDTIIENPGAPKIDDLDSLPLLSYDYYPVKELDLDLLRIEAGRGCPFACTFCSTAQFFQRKFRLKSAPRLVEELDRLNALYGHTEFKLDHDLFTVNKQKVREFCHAVKDRGYHWRVSARVDCVDEPLLELMAEAGCIGLYFGIETGSERMQKISQKRLKLELVDPILKVSERLGIEATVSYITGYPQETQTDQDDTLDRLGTCFGKSANVVIPQLHILAPEPGTPLFTEFGGAMKYDGYATNFNAALLGKNDRAIILSNPLIFPNYFYYPTVMPRDDHIFAVEFMDVLRALGGKICSYLLRFYQGRLSVLVKSFRAWTYRNGYSVSTDPLRLDRYIAEKFGSDHHLYSLVRFAIEANRLRVQNKELEQSHAADNESFLVNSNYRLSEQALLLPDIHDCGKLIDKIGQLPKNEVLSQNLVGELVYSLSLITPQEMHSFVIDEGAYGILDLFRSSRSAAQFVEHEREATSLSSGEHHVFQTLLDIGALVKEDVRQSAA